ncbi:MAG: ADP-forming succinate--CoA ligase subunit beta [Lentisphaeria bacterium]|nr:ADP-forming succinate--CoA ligase subunit beta [Lentisphaeria bacterium]NQZ71298.1 ADP-forming succinate--CoA ligase subunit beta [Lentisphaeria bacterium]
MKLHEYQAKEIFAKYGVPVQAGIVITDKSEAAEAVAKIQKDSGAEAVVVKAQIHAGGRGKGGGVKFSPTTAEAIENINAILGMTLITPQTGPQGQLVKKVYITEAVDIQDEYYLAITSDRAKECPVIIASAEGGVEIEEIAKTNPELIAKVWIDERFGIQPFQIRQVVGFLGFTGDTAKQAGKLLSCLYKAYIGTDSTLAEINPLVVTTDGQVSALDAKFSVDDNALYRHKDIAEMRDTAEEDPTEVEAGEYDLSYVNLDGNVGCMVNGAGLAMATMDIIKLKGGEPANFLDVGGGANPTTVKNGFRIILQDPAVKAVLINIFGGIVRCDRIANGVIEALQELDLNVPVVVRLQGTNAEEAKEILANADVDIISAVELDEAAEKVVALATS